MFTNEMNNPTFSVCTADSQAQKKEKKHSNDDNSHSHSEEHPKGCGHITVVPFSRTKTGSFQ